MIHAMRFLNLLVLVLTLTPAMVAAVDDDDVRKPVEAQPMRPSIHSRSLPRVIQLAEENSPNIKKAKNALEIAEREKDNAFWRFFPTLDLEGKHGLLDDNISTKASPSFSEVNLVLKEHLYDPDQNATLARYRLHKAKYERAQMEYQYQRDEQLMRVAQAYLDWSASLQQREIDENKRDLLRRQYNVLDAQYKQGQKTRRDVLRIETEIKRLGMDILRRDNEIDLGFQKLAASVGLSQKDLESYKIEGEEAKPYGIVGTDPEELRVSDHMRSRIFERREEELAQETAFAKRNYWPRVSFEGELKYNNHDYLNRRITWPENESWTWSALVVLRYNFWDFGIRRRDMEIAQIKERNVADENRQSLFDLATELRDVFLRLREYRENVKTSRELLVLEQQSYSILEAEYRNGRASYLDLITNLNSLIDARSKFMSSYFGMKKQQVLYSFHSGALYKDLKKN